MAITVRLIARDELPQLLLLYSHLNPVDAPLPSDDVLQSLWDKILSDPRLYYIVADLSGQLVATCHLIIVPNLTRGARPYGIIENVVTHSDYRQMGIGTQVLHYALNLAWKQQCYKVMLLSGSKREETLRFYEQAGFQRGVKTGFIALPPEEFKSGSVDISPNK
ncbi:GCN5 family acetyltransferase [Scytonema hofmannii PCC 7110]|uniref:GCN5 family acetyltransferase n=1 Tax=Scytonema hofmannii PCC 7110 TaxID=128403 RepID=A0A139X2D8_9CYAN|nr:GNAT family N-acetyltransferase [Scytonema hofmannii]KYC38869.1 GCN5 family acetyltransferase [Scytonema hofmannii PCC 7110]